MNEQFPESEQMSEHSSTPVTREALEALEAQLAAVRN